MGRCQVTDGGDGFNAGGGPRTNSRSWGSFPTPNGVSAYADSESGMARPMHQGRP